MTYEYEQYLAHHGIKGQKWGQRRFQNEDGTLTDEGKKRYGWYYSDQINRLAREKNSDKYKKPETRERKQKEYDSLVRKAEFAHKAAAAMIYGSLAISVAQLADIVTHGAVKRLPKQIFGKAVSKIINSKAAASVAQNIRRRKTGGYTMRKKDYWIGNLGLNS